MEADHQKLRNCQIEDKSHAKEKRKVLTKNMLVIDQVSLVFVVT